MSLGELAAPKYLFPLLAAAFLLLGLWRCIQARGLPAQARTWLLCGAIFSAVSAWLWWRLPASV
jgi:hypothetical protein